MRDTPNNACDECLVRCGHCGLSAPADLMARLDDCLICADCDDDHGPAARRRYNRARAIFNRPACTDQQWRSALRVQP